VVVFGRNGDIGMAGGPRSDPNVLSDQVADQGTSKIVPSLPVGNANLGISLGQDQAGRLGGRGPQNFAAFDSEETPQLVDEAKHIPRLISTQFQPSFQVLDCYPNG
jgi:hypothetical protein